jgi:maltose alpha-D-glucosyltransferase/alpha-amylase
VPEERVGELLEPASLCGLARVKGPKPGLICDGMADPAYCRALLNGFIEGRSVHLGGGELSVVALPALAEVYDPDNCAPSPPPNREERSNPAVVFGDRMILKGYRRAEGGVNPDLEVGRFLTERQNFTGAPRVLGYIEYRRRHAEPATVSVLHAFVPHQGDAWRLALDDLSRYFERVAALPKERLAAPPPPPVPLLVRPNGPDEMGELAGPFLPTAKRIGELTAELHEALASDQNDPAFAPEPFGQLYQRSVYQSMRNLTGHVCQRLAAQLESLPEAARGPARRLLDAQDVLLKRFRAFREVTLTAQRIRCHGDYQLRHLLHTGSDFMVIDFEGDPSRAIGERRIKRSPLRDVASMVRSFHYAALSALHGLETGRGQSPGVIRPEDRAVLTPWAQAWYNRVAREFVTAYVERIEPAGLLPPAESARALLLEQFLLEKALHEVGTELSDRPEWVLMPLLGILDLLGEPAA